ncbi:MAG: metallophosphoesterase family protein [Gammaproteobacteria bacterium]|nr:metallophosphoesterase family protein [Gammaproteobacteria bacterium]MBU1416300.1 metallophosphoesterase family protein [Gammaproteobacteria bacterium]
MKPVSQFRIALLFSLLAAGSALATYGCGGGGGGGDGDGISSSGSSSSGISSGGTSSTSSGTSSSGSSSGTVTPTGALELPVAGQSVELVRYPFLQVADSPDSIRIVWATASSGTSQAVVRPAGSSSATTVTASQAQYASGVTGITTFYQQEALLTGLQPGGEYVYDIVHKGATLARNVPFVALKAATATSLNFIAFGDSGTQYSEPRNVRNAISSRDAIGDYVYPHDFVVGLGDIAYNTGSHAEYDANFFDQMSARGDDGDGARGILADRPFVPALANHDYDQSYANTPDGFLDSFVLPTDGVPAADAERYFSFDAGDAHFVVLDSMKFDTTDSSETANRLQAMLDWLAADLAATTRTWRIAFFHHTIFSAGTHGTYGDIGINRLMRQKLAPILQAHGVQLAMFGHDHLYERSKRLSVDASGKIVRSATCNGITSNVVESTAGIVYVVAGNGGGDLYRRQTDPTKVCGTATYASDVANYGDGYDFVAMNGSAPALYDDYVSGEVPATPTIRHGFTHVAIAGTQLTITSYNYEGVVMDRYTMSAH